MRRAWSATETSKTHRMNSKQIEKLVDDAITLHREIAAKTEQLKTLKAILVLEAHAHHDEQVLTETGGTRWVAKGSDGSIARVNFPAPGLVSELDGQSDEAKQAQLIAGDQFRRLFTTAKIYQLVDNFRTEAAALLPAPKAEALTSLCETECAPRVSFEITKRAEPAANA
jgi:hypothetical protein